jgi:acyl dehydratase
VTYFTEVVSKRESASRPDWGLVFVLNTGVNQRGELVLSFDGSAFVPRRVARR